MPNVFEITDPRGRKVVCTEDRWKWHILSSHPWMTGWESEVMAAIQTPTIGIYQDAESENRHIYYMLPEGRKRYIKVVVDFDDQAVGTVITAFPTDSPKPGERLIWPE
jgi:hypothetical protein